MENFDPTGTLQQWVTQAVDRMGRPQVTSIFPDAHVFHYHDTWLDDNIVMLNRNGNYMRLVKHEKNWHLLKTWNGIFNYVSWMRTGLQRKDPVDLITLAGTGPQGRDNFETLSLLPKGFTNRRKAVWRHKVLDVRFDVDNDRFRLSDPEGTQVQWFDGKVWESRNAASWCADVFGGSPKSSNPLESLVAAQEHEQMQQEAAWGLF